MLFYRRAHIASIKSTLIVLESLLCCFSRNRLATMCIKQSNYISSNNRSHIARSQLFIVGAYTPSYNIVRNDSEVKSALALSLSHL